MDQTFTITFGEQVENHVGMKKLGKLAESGFTLDDLKIAGIWFHSHGIQTNIYDLSSLLRSDGHDPSDAYLLIAKNGLSVICSPDNFHLEQFNLEKDKKALMRGRVVNKFARYNLCFDDIAINPNYQLGQGTVVSFENVPYLNLVRKTLSSIIGEKASNLKAEGNYYYDINKCGIGYHGDSERKLVIGIRTGADMCLCFRWFKSHQQFGDTMKFNLQHGDIYIMSEKTVGTDWKKSKIFTLRHAAGSNKFIN